MKRSEAVKRIVKILSVNNEQCPTSIFQANNILSILENEIGMIPPDRSGCGCNDPECCGGKDHNWTEEDSLWNIY